MSKKLHTLTREEQLEVLAMMNKIENDWYEIHNRLIGSRVAVIDQFVDGSPLQKAMNKVKSMLGLFDL